MSKKVTRLSEVVPPAKPEGLTEARWFVIEHQVIQARMSLQTALLAVGDVEEHTDSDNEWLLAGAVHDRIKTAYIAVQECHDRVTQLLAGTEIAERLGRKEL